MHYVTERKVSTEAQEQIKHVADALSVGTAVATVAGWLPAIAAVFTIIWTGIRIYETDTIQALIKRLRS
jgi:hypothetical protein